ncbi:MAG: A/G-specific adenine glycosylase, partial [Pseudomonadota bacterium]
STLDQNVTGDASTPVDNLIKVREPTTEQLDNVTTPGMTKENRKSKSNDRADEINVEECRGRLLSWYDKHRRILPWRAAPGQKPNPYHVWLSEIMLQQTTVTAVKPYFEKFLSKWPTIHDLAKANQDEIMNEWAGLGYYNRARNLHKCAKEIINKYNGLFPSSEVRLKELSGVGDYTSAAIRTIAFNEPATVVDGNIERVISRLFSILQPLPKSKNYIKQTTSLFFNDFNERPGDLAQSFMDLGASICIAKTPRCSLCPIENHCSAKASGIADTLPRKERKKPKPQKYGEVYWIVDNNDRILLHRRPDKGLLANMLALPTSEWNLTKKYKVLNKIKNIKLFADKSTSIKHTFTHFDLELELKIASNNGLKGDYEWRDFKDINPQDFPTVFRKPFKIFMKAHKNNTT